MDFFAYLMEYGINHRSVHAPEYIPISIVMLVSINVMSLLFFLSKHKMFAHCAGHYIRIYRQQRKQYETTVVLVGRSLIVVQYQQSKSV